MVIVQDSFQPYALMCLSQQAKVQETEARKAALGETVTKDRKRLGSNQECSTDYNLVYTSREYVADKLVYLIWIFCKGPRELHGSCTRFNCQR